MLEKISNIISNTFPFLKEKRLLIAISGGLDSVVLTRLLSTLKFDITLAHCNFNLRGIESNLDAIFVEELAKELAVKCFSTSFKTEKLAKEKKESTQIAARNLRYHWFQEISARHHFDYILTAHHADDNLETFLINLTRGTGLAGFTGIPPVHGNVIRPLLQFSREEILHFAKENNICWREDQSNASTKYLRNKIRHKILPVLKDINPNMLASFSKTLENLQESAQIISDRIEETSLKICFEENGVTKFKISEILKLSNPKAYLFQFLKAYHFSEFKDVYNLLSAQSGKHILSSTHVLLKDREFLILSERKLSNSSDTLFQILEDTPKITNPIHLNFEEVTEQSAPDKKSIYVSKKSLKFPLIVRKWKNGDYFYPLGMQGKKKLSKYFKDEKLSLIEKQNQWLLCDANDAIIWIIGMRKDNRFDVRSNTGIIEISSQ
ncbi:putative cell-cycle protein [Polaribacter irgensii 23-P]|uniref:tRNA(Ile)-lysidine synthase n=1 Tax=Polaribacter irgensii 23-P TaxID=313594 RepID=A4BW69_9FLAO|nr:tRNA lysidine(34) synthetase TilS [Polaribacter irgensii]EAR13210.1 putative cell-cycle protein [Polaribacter irgensii 23-P]